MPAAKKERAGRFTGTDQRSSYSWWTRTQRIRTAAEIPFEAALLETTEPPLYHQIAPKAMRLRELGLSLSCIARHLGVTDKTVAKSLAARQRASRLQKGQR